MKKIVISIGPIPSKLDSVKFITNRFKGGLAFKTATYLYEKGYDINIVKWEYSKLPSEPIDFYPNIINVKDVFEYYNWFRDNANNYDVFIMAAAVANLTPSNPYEGKFPSHNYKVGEKFNIEFEIAPRAIDIIKQINPRATLIGYKLFDAKDDKELIEIGRHTLHDSKANVIFANTPSTAKTKKIALLQDNSAIPMSFDEHLEFIEKVIESTYFKTEIIDIDEELSQKLLPFYKMIEHFEKTIDGYGTIAIRTPYGGIVTTSRGHKGNPIFIKNIDFNKKIIYAVGKATLNAPLLFNLLKENKDLDYIIHRHELLEEGVFVCTSYQLPGTMEETKTISEFFKFTPNVNIEHHGYIKGYSYKEVDWNNYYKDFPSKYFGYPIEMDIELEKYKDKKTLEIGGNIKAKTKYVLDPNVSNKNSKNIKYDDLKTMKFDLILAKNSIAYLSEKEIDCIINSLSPNGKFLANVFLKAPNLKVTENEISYLENGNIEHFLFKEDNIIKHNFHAYPKEFYEKKGFIIKQYGSNSGLLIYNK